MARPINGLAGQQQIPLSQPSQQNNQNNAVRQQEERETQPNRVQPQGAPAAESQNSDATDNRFQQALEDRVASAISSQENGEAVRRGSLVDLSV